MRYNPILHGHSARWDVERKPHGGGGKGDKPDQIPVIPARATTGFGTAIADPMTGQYSYNLDPRLAAMRDQFYGGAQGFLPSQQDLQFAQGVSGFGRDVYGQGSNYLTQAMGMSPQQASENYYARIQDLQAPSRAQEESRLADTLFKTGRGGAAIGYGGGYINPEQFGLLSARANADKALGLEAETYGRQLRQTDINSALNLQQAGLGNVTAGYGLGMLPYQSASNIFGLGTGIEQLGMQPMQTAMVGLQAQLALQKQQQAYENATADSGKGGGLLGGVVNAGLNYAMSGGNPVAAGKGAIQGMSGGKGGSGMVSPSTIMPGYGGYGSQVLNYGSQPSSLLGGNAALPNYQISPWG
jgi:hypothetical protein